MCCSQMRFRLAIAAIDLLVCPATYRRRFPPFFSSTGLAARSGLAAGLGFDPPFFFLLIIIPATGAVHFYRFFRGWRPPLHFFRGLKPSRRALLRFVQPAARLEKSICRPPVFSLRTPLAAR